MAIHDYRKETINAYQLELGMFVSELDRPWLDSPFMLQGFLLEDEKQIRQIQSLCKTVVIDRTLSIGEHYAATPKESSAIKSRNISLNSPTVSPVISKSTTNEVSEKTNFLDILRELNEKKAAGSPSSNNGSGIDTKLKSIPSTSNNSPISTSYSSSTPLSLKDHIKNDLSNVLGNLKKWVPGSKSSKKDSNSATSHSSNAFLQVTTDEIVPVEEEIAVIYPVFEQTQIATRAIFEAIATESKIDLIHVNQTLDSMVDSIERNPDALMWLTKLKQQDNYAYNHALNVSINLMAFASFTALPKPQIKDIGMAGLLQDIGKLKIAPELLQKEDQLSGEELDVMKSHVQIGLEMLRKTESVSPKVLEIIANHHERIDGEGYPLKLKAGEFSMAAQMAGLMDSYCALTADKPYAKALFNQEALEQLYASADKDYSTALVNQLIQFFGIYPVSSLVELNSGEVAVVIQQNHVRRLQPRVMVLLNADKTINKHPAVIDLIHLPTTPNGEVYKIVRGLPPNSYGLNPTDFFTL